MADTPLNLTPNRCRQQRHRYTSAAVALLTAVTLTACGTSTGPSQKSTAPAIIESTSDDDFEGTLVDPPFDVAPITLRDTDGNPVRLDQLPDGQANAVFFGFTYCPDICPTTMADLASAQRSLPTEFAERVGLYFVSVDPDRDTPRALRSWLDEFDPGITGLRGSPALVNQAERSLYAVESTVGPSPTAHDHGEPAHDDRGDESGPHAHKGGYEVNHSGSVYVFGPDGEAVLYTGGYTVAQYAADFTRLLEAPR